MRKVLPLSLASVVGLFYASSAFAAQCNGNFIFSPFNTSTWAGTSWSGNNVTSITFGSIETVTASPLATYNNAPNDFASGPTAVPGYPDYVTVQVLPLVVADGQYHADSVTDFIVFGSTTTPANRYHFDLTSLQETWLGSNLDINGKGILHDVGGTFEDTAASFSIGQLSNGGSNTVNGIAWSFSTSPIPEPASLAVLALGVLPLLARRRK